MSIKGCGCDIVKIERFKGVSQRFLEKYFTENELKYIKSKSIEKQAETTAGLFSVKESMVKAIGIGGGDGLKFSDIEITHTEKGQPIAKINHELYKNLKIHVSISHSEIDAISFAVID